MSRIRATSFHTTALGPWLVLFGMPRSSLRKSQHSWWGHHRRISCKIDGILSSRESKDPRCGRWMAGPGMVIRWVWTLFYSYRFARYQPGPLPCSFPILEHCPEACHLLQVPDGREQSSRPSRTWPSWRSASLVLHRDHCSSRVQTATRMSYRIQNRNRGWNATFHTGPC